jgi:tetratricopeptide (TPR) repeat protein
MPDQKPRYTKSELNALAVFALDYYQQGKVAQAERMYKRLVIAEDSVYSFYGYAGLGAIALNQDPPRLDDACTHLTIAADLNPKDTSVHTNLGEVFLRQKKFTEAASELQKAVDLDPETRDPGANRARALLTALKALQDEAEKPSATPQAEAGESSATT